MEGGYDQLRSQDDGLLPCLHTPPLLSARQTPQNVNQLYDSAVTKRALSASANSEMRKKKTFQQLLMDG